MATRLVPPDFTGRNALTVIKAYAQGATPRTTMQTETVQNLLRLFKSKCMQGKDEVMLMFTKGDDVGFVHHAHATSNVKVVPSNCRGDGEGGTWTQRMHETQISTPKHTAQRIAHSATTTQTLYPLIAGAMA